MSSNRGHSIPTIKHPFKLLFLLCVLACAPVGTYAAETALDDKKYTPFGSERNGNDDGSIPAWQGDKDYADKKYSELVSETPLFEITENNYNQYAEYLSDGQKALFATYPSSFKMPVYTSYRLHNIPDHFASATFKNKQDAILIDDGNGLDNVWPGIPFPSPDNALEIIWNHTTSWRGLSFSASYTEASIRPNEATTIIKSKLDFASPFHDPNREKYSGNGKLFYFLATTYSPALLAGGATLVHESTQPRLSPRKTWIYVKGNKRVQRLPSLTHDGPNMNSEHIRVIDEVNLFNGAPDRYNWKIIAKKEHFIPYNNNRLAARDKDIGTILGSSHIDPNMARYEKHRVWVVEGTLKDSENHLYKKRVFYIDEDSWLIVLAEQYNDKDELWRTSSSYIKYYPDMPGTFTVLDSFHDLSTNNYYIQAITQQNKKAIEFFDSVLDTRRFMPAALSRGANR